MDRPTFVYVTYITTTPEKLWEALTEGEFTRRYWGGSATFETTRHGWPAIRSSLKSLLETGSPLPFQGLGFGPSSKQPGRL